MSLRLANQMMHFGYRRTHAHTAVIIHTHGLEATTLPTEGEVVAEHHIDPDKHYGRASYSRVRPSTTS